MLPAPPEEIWARPARVKTLRYIAAPYASFRPAGPAESAEWKEGAVLRFRLRVFGTVPLGTHKVRAERFDRDSYVVQTSEGNRTVPVWNRRTVLVPLDAASARYTDEVEVQAGRLTGPVHHWSRSFYRHRQRKWRRLLAKRS